MHAAQSFHYVGRFDRKRSDLSGRQLESATLCINDDSELVVRGIAKSVSNKHIAVVHRLSKERPTACPFALRSGIEASASGSMGRVDLATKVTRNAVAGNARGASNVKALASGRARTTAVAVIATKTTHTATIADRARWKIEGRIISEAKRLQSEDIASYDRDGAVCLRGIFDARWIDLLGAGVERNRREPGRNARRYTLEGQPGMFFGDYCNWHCIVGER